MKNSGMATMAKQPKQLTNTLYLYMDILQG